MNEKALQLAVIELARLLGWKVAYFRPARVMRGGGETYETPIGADGKGWPDLTLAHPKQRRLLFVELKARGGRLSAAQCDWLDTLTDTECCEPYCWTPLDWTDGTVERLLRRMEDGSDASGCTCGWPDAPCQGGDGIECQLLRAALGVPL